MELKRPNWIFVDYENLQEIEWDRLAKLPVQVVLFTGGNQKLPVETLKKGLEMEGRLRIMVSAAKGKNALDFQMAFYAGGIAERCPDAFFHFVTRDTGFDALVSYIRKETKAFAERVESIAALKFLNPPIFVAMSLQEQVEHATARLQKMGNARPKTKKTLLSTLAAAFAKELDEASIQKVFKSLVFQGKVCVGERETISYVF